MAGSERFRGDASRAFCAREHAVEPGSAAREVLSQSRALRAAIADAVAAPEARRQAARRAYESVCGDVVRAELAKMLLDRIKEITQGRLRLAAIEQAGFRNRPL